MRNSLSIVLSGEAGQGLQTTEELLVAAASMSYHVFSVKDVMSRVRGGNNTVEIRISDEPIHAFQNTIDLLFLLNDNSLYRLTDRVHDQTVIWGEKELGLQETAKESGGAMFLSVVLFGFIARLLNLDQKSCNSLIQNRFASKSDKIITDNLNAFDAGYRKGASFSIPKQIKAASLSKKYKTIDGNIAVGIGALAGGCNFISSYPMSPSTGVLIYLVNQSKDFGIVTEQAEDEIAAANMAIGAWYAGARGLVTTSGGGFDLMQEAISLSGITETPCVIHLAQRPGPGTGLPTRTEQADLNLAIYSGHGEFPKIVLAPGNLEDAVRLTQKAFYLADKYQVPVFILTDQFLLDSNGQMEPLILDDKYLHSFIVETDPDYRRYALNESGISLRGIPGFGTGFVKVDSDEHDESGMITEDYKMRNHMNEKRLKKRELLLSEYEGAELIGPKKFTHLVVGWGSTYGVLKEFIETCGRDDTSFLNIKQVFPLHENLIPYFKQAKSITVVENNATGQLVSLLKTELDIHVNHSILKYSGEPFSIEEIEQKIKGGIGSMKDYEMEPNLDIAWCPGCGNFSIRTALIQALQELSIKPNELVFASGIGQAAKMPQYLDTNYFNGLHGRALPPAVAIKACNPELTVIAEGGDGDMYGEGGNHFLHNIRRNPDITHLVHNNMVYGLTKGQASPTSQKQFITPVQINGVTNTPFNPLAIALSLGATFVARAFSGDIEQTKEIIKKGIQHKGYALIDIFQPCVSFNKINNFAWYREHTYYLEESYDTNQLLPAMEKALQTDRYPLGLLYQRTDLPTFEENLTVYQADRTPVTKRQREINQVNKLLNP